VVNWNDPKSMISKHFTVHEATWLPSWRCHHVPSESEKANLIKMATKADAIRDTVGLPMTVHVWIRPSRLNCPGFDPHTVTCKNDAQRAALAALDYNAFVGGAGHSGHIPGLALDYDCGEDCDVTRARLEPKLDSMNIRMERKPGGKWVHNDVITPHPNRYFIP